MGDTILVASIEAWFEVLPGNRPVFIAVVTVALSVIGVTQPSAPSSANTAPLQPFRQRTD